MNDTRSKFEAALAQRKRQAAEDAVKGKGVYGGFTEIPYSALYTDKQQAFRFVGLPYTVREKPTDSKRIFMAMIMGDDDKKFRCIGPDPNEHKDWILYRVMNKVLTRHWDKNIQRRDGKLGDYVYDYATQHPELYTRVAKNNNTSNPYENGWKFTPSILFNVIDRENYAWHKENKKYRVLSKKASESNDKVYFEPGVPDTVFNNIMDDIVAFDGNTNWEDYDIVIKKTNDQPWYKVYHGTDDMKRLDESVKPLIVTTGLTDEEKSWEMNDFDALFKVTSYTRIKSKLGLFFQKVDQVLKTAYFNELCALVDKEEQENAAKEASEPVQVRESSVASNTQNFQSTPTPVSQSTPVAQPTPTPEVDDKPPVFSALQGNTPADDDIVVPQASPQSSETPMTDAIWAELENGTRLWRGGKFNGISLMTPEEKSMVIAIDENNQFVWKKEAGTLYECGASGFLSPEMVHVDPVSAQVFE